MRDSTEVTIETGLSYLVIALVGFAFMALGGGGIWFEYHPAPAHTTHVIAFVCLFVAGGLILLIGLGRKRGLSVVQSITVIATPFVPKFGGMRAGDPPAEIEIPPRAEP